jgi:4-hydroxy-tetrahydrodipicolinate synthase
MPLHDAMFCEPSPAPAKYGASLLGHCTPEVRLPLIDLTETGQAVVKTAMKGCGLPL